MSFEPITRGNKGATFYKADLHLHTPGSHDYQDDVTAEEYVQALVDNGIDIAAITDHDSDGMYDEIREEAEDTSIEVLPGVELTTPGGGEHEIHMLAIFPPEKADAVNEILGGQGLITKDPGEGVADDNIWKISKQVQEKGGLPILAHVDSTCGALNEYPRSTRTRQRVFNESRIAALEAIDPEAVKEDYDIGEFTFIRSSDAHSVDQIGERATYLKMNEPTFDGLEAALLDPGSRLRLAPPSFDHAVIKGLRIDGEFFQNKELQLNRGLNCLIGGRGQGKSTTIEHIRYALDIQPEKSRIKEEHNTNISENCGDGGEIEVYIETIDNDEYVVKRIYGEEPEIFKANGRKVPLSIDEFKEEFFNVEIFGQNQLYEIALDVSSQRDLLDSYFNITDLFDELEAQKSELRQNGQNISLKESTAEEYNAELSNVEVLRENIKRLEEKGIESYIKGEENWDEEKNYLRRLSEAIESFKEDLSELDVETSLSQPNQPDDQPNKELMEAATEEFENVYETVETEIEEINSTLDSGQETIEELRDRWDGKYDARQKEIRELAEEVDDEIQVDIEKYWDMKAREQDLQAKEDELKEVQEETSDLYDKREELLDGLEAIRSKISNARRAGIARINGELEEVKISLNEDSDRGEFIEWLQEKLTGSDVRVDDRKTVAEKLDPQELAEIVKKREYNKLEDIGLTETAVHNLIDHTPIRDDLFELEIQEIEDKPIIKIKEKGGGWKSMEKMSDGQKCTSLLSIALLERDIPLIIDQPEDALDNEFIYSTVVQLIRDIKHERQILVCTHNANIPVLGDAELIIENRASNGKGHFCNRGSIDDPTIKTRCQIILEGGRQAFDLRTEKYGR